MRSNIRVFQEAGIKAKGKLLPLSEFVIARDSHNRSINDEIGPCFVLEAEKMLEEDIPFLPLSLYRENALTGVRSHFEKSHHRRRTMLLYMTLAEVYERKGRFVEKIADVLWAIMEETSWVIPAHYFLRFDDPKASVPEVHTETTKPVLDLYAANCSVTVALSAFLLKDELDAISPTIRKRAYQRVYQRGIHPFITHTYSWSGEDEPCENWLTNITFNILAATAMIAEDNELRERVADRAMYLLDNFTSYYAEDGWCDEGPGYWGAAGGNYFDCLELLEDMSGGEINVYHHPLIKNMGEYIANAHIDGQYYLNFADAAPKIEQDGKHIARFGKKCGSASLQAFGEMIASGNRVDRPYYFNHAYRVYKNALAEEIRGGQKTLASKCVWYKHNKVAIFRQSEDSSKGLYLAMKGGNNKECHNHNDVGCIIVYADGSPVFVDPGHGSYDHDYFGAMRYERWYTKSSYHSIPLVDGIEQIADGFENCSTEEYFDEQTPSVSMELKNAFPKKAGIESMRRTCSLSDGTVTVKDEVKLDHVGDIQMNYLTVDEPLVKGENTLLLAGNVAFTYRCEGASLVIEKVENTFLPYEDLDFEFLWGRKCLWRICLKVKADAATAEISIKQQK